MNGISHVDDLLSRPLLLSFVFLVVVDAAKEEDEDEEEQVDEDTASDDEEGLRADMAGMNVGRGATIAEDGTVIHFPPIISPMMPLIPPVPFYDPELSGFLVEMVILLFSGTCREDLRCTVQPGGKILSVRWTWPEFILDSTRPEVESQFGTDIFHAELTANQLGVRRLRPQDDEPVHVTMNYELPMQCEEKLVDGAVEFLAYVNTNPEHVGQHSYYLKVRLRGVRKGARAPAIPGIRVVRPHGPRPARGPASDHNHPP